MTKASTLFSLIFLMVSVSQASSSPLITCVHKGLNLQVKIKEIQPFSVGNKGRMVDLTSADLEIVKDGVVESVGALGPRNENLESFRTDSGTGIEFSTDELGRVSAKFYSSKFKLRSSTASGLECEDHRDAFTQKWMKAPSQDSAPAKGAQ